MSTITSDTPTPDLPLAEGKQELSGFWAKADTWFERWGEKLNPILVKEARQALKSKQFLITFTLVLVCAWGWSLIYISMGMPAIYYAPSGAMLLAGYACILVVPLALIVPFSAYRSLAAEREDGTYELLSITTLSARQIVTGKLGSAILQMLVYFSAIAPCIAFTYLLRGVNIITILILLVYAFLGSLVLSAFGLLIATASLARHVQTLLSVVLLVGLCFATIGGFAITIETVEWQERLGFDESWFWVGNACFITFYASFLTLIVLASSAQLSFASDNRSTKLRIVMLVQQMLIIGWVVYYWLTDEPYDEMFLLMFGFSGAHWMIMGSLLTGELAQISQRVQRKLPQSTLGRALFTWFNPGSGTGYGFAVVNLVAAATVISIVGLVAKSMGYRGAPNDADSFLFGWLICGYVAAYLGLGRLLILLARKRMYFGLLLPFMIHVLLLLGGAAIPTFTQAWFDGFNRMQYSVLQTTNWIWTLGEAAEGDLYVEPLAPMLVGIGAIGIFLLNMAVAAKEVEQTRQAAPERVIEDELELHPELAVDGKEASPWDNDEEDDA